ncbi:MAG TPA: aconitase X catalytic domain-containing protein [Anaerolineae bacterium]|nr:aconitase X catalytic domain-containing protein [Anaerolineae bacterium]
MLPNPKPEIQNRIRLTAEERAWLAGEAGPAIRRAMEIVAALAQIYGAERLTPVASVQISGVSYRNIGPAGLAFLRKWADEGASVRVPTTLNPAAMDLEAWAEQGFDPTFAAQQQAVIAAFAQMGVGGAGGESGLFPTCTPYLVGNVPRLGESVAWAESSAVAYANSVLGARTNREGGPGAIAAALVGRTGAYGLHLEENRRATLHVRVRAALRTISDYSALGALVGQRAGSRIPYFEGLPLERGAPLWEENLKALGAALAATGAVGVFHVAGVTPEALAGPVLAPERETMTVADLAPGYATLTDAAARPALIWIGCPHASLAEIALVAGLVRGKRLRLPLWITCARPVKAAAVAQGLAGDIAAAGGRLYADACLAIAPVRDLGFATVMTPSAKGACYLRNLAGVSARFGTLEECVHMAVTGGE